MGLYEIQVLDSFEDGTAGPLTYSDGQCGALYKQRPPMVNASEWCSGGCNKVKKEGRG